MAKKPNGLVAVEKGIPITEAKKHGRPMKYPWYTMKVGDSFRSDSKLETLRQVSYNYRHVGQFIVRAEDKGCRVWRVK